MHQSTTTTTTLTKATEYTIYTEEKKKSHFKTNDQLHACIVEKELKTKTTICFYFCPVQTKTH